jgi:WD40 repeat protein
MTRQQTVVSLLFALVVASVASADDEEPVSYYHQVRPIFQARCHGCHQPAKTSGEFVMTEFPRLLTGGESEEPAIVPGKPVESYLIEMVTPEDDVASMPPEGEPLSETELSLIRRWIEEGAKDDTPESARRTYDADHPPVYKMRPVITSLDFSPDGQLLAVSGYHEVLLHKADGSELVGRLVGMSERIESAIFSPDGKRLAVTGGSPGRMGELQVWSVERKELELSLPVAYDTVYGASFSPDGKLIAFGCPDNSMRIVDADTGEQVLYNGAHSDWVLDTTFSLKGTHLISVSRDRSMKLVEVATERFVDNITSITPGALTGGLQAVDRHPSQDQVLIGGADGIPKIYRIFREQARKIGDDFNLIRKFPKMPGRVFDVEFSADATRVVAGSSDQGKGHVHVFNAADGKLIAQMAGQGGGVFAVTFHPDGKQVASGGFGGTVRINDATTGELIKSFVPVPLE